MQDHELLTVIMMLALTMLSVVYTLHTVGALK